MPIVKFELCRNPKAMRSGVGLLRLVQDSDVWGGDAQDSGFEWARPLRRDRTSATYDLEPGFYVLVTDTSSHKNARKNWIIVQVIPEGAAVVREEAKVWRENTANGLAPSGGRRAATASSPKSLPRTKDAGRRT
jgi:hypothetical protein